MRVICIVTYKITDVHIIWQWSLSEGSRRLVDLQLRWCGVFSLCIIICAIYALASNLLLLVQYSQLLYSHNYELLMAIICANVHMCSASSMICQWHCHTRSFAGTALDYVYGHTAYSLCIW